LLPRTSLAIWFSTPNLTKATTIHTIVYRALSHCGLTCILRISSDLAMISSKSLAASLILTLTCTPAHADYWIDCNTPSGDHSQHPVDTTLLSGYFWGSSEQR